MSGDVFGNGMLSSRTLRLVAAFDHRDVFLDPDPDAEASYAERQRLFDMPRSSWQDYDRDLLSPGGMVVSRQEKSVALTDEVRAALRVDDEELPPALRFEQQLLPIDAGLPSQLLTNRPDILQAEHNLRAANANIGAARAAYFPQISLTGLFGFASNALGGLFDGGNQAWSYGGAAGLPIFDWGRREGQLNLSRAQADELTAAYQRTVQGAFQEVADALVARRRYAEQIEIQGRTLEAQRRLAHTARLRYDNGIAIYLEVLDAERNLFAASQAMITLRATELQNAVSLYTALGGGTTDPRGISPATDQ